MSRTSIVRRPDRAEGGLTPDEQARMEEHARLWIGRIMRTDPIEPDKIVPAIHRLYEAAGLRRPRVVIVPSPRVMAFAGGFASAIWWLRSHEATSAATREATYAATNAATDAAIRVATTRAARDATYIATDAAAREATYAATYVATYAATRNATNAATDAAIRVATYYAATDATDDTIAHATREATRKATRAATYDAHAATTDVTRETTHDATLFVALAKQLLDANWRLGIACADAWERPYQGGNMWGAWECYLTAARDILGLRLGPHDKYRAWEECAIHGGYRWMHPEFCMVCDFPEVLRMDDQDRPHCADGPSHRWRDGWELYYWHGVLVTEQIIRCPDTMTAAQIEAEQNAEVRRVMIERFGEPRYLQESGAEMVNEDEFGQLFRKQVEGDEDMVMVRVLNSTPEPDGTYKPYWLRVAPDCRPLIDGGEPQELTALNAVASTFGLTGGAYLRQLVEQS